MNSLPWFVSLVVIVAAGALISPIVQWHPFVKRMIGSALFLFAVCFNLVGQSVKSTRWMIPPHEPGTKTWLAFLVIIILLVADFFAASDEENLENYPPVRTSNWTWGLLLSSMFTWIVYLSCYEMVIRGLFFFESIRLFGKVPALIINAAVCSLAHWLKSRREALASIPMALLMCYITLQSESFWYAALAHAALAVAHEIFSIRANPTMRFMFISTSTK